VGFVAGPALGALGALGGPRVPFLIAAGIAAINTVVAIRRLPETHTERHAVTSTPKPPFSSVADVIVLAFVTLVAFSGFEATFALLANKRLGFEEASAGATFVGVGLVLTAVQGGMIGPVVRRLGESLTVRIGLLANAVGLLLLASVHSWWQLIPSLLALAVGQGLVTPALSSLLAGRVHQNHRGGAMGLQQSAGGLGRLIGPLLAGVLFQHVSSSAPYLLGAVVMALAAAATLRSWAPESARF
jgi:predicted MFS family arabinose efflux permease